MSQPLSRRLLASLAFGWIATALPAAAAERATFSDAAFDAARAAGRPIVVEVHAPWCPVCRAQAPHIAAVLAEPDMSAVLVLKVDFDTQKEALRRLNVQRQSTLIAFNGQQERARMAYSADPAQIRQTLRAAL